MCQKLQNKTLFLNVKGGQWLWRHNQQFLYFREIIKRWRDLHMLQKRQRHLQPLVQRHRSWERRDKATRLPPLEGLYYAVQLLSLWMKSRSVTTQLKATKKYFSVVLFIMLCSFWVCGWNPEVWPFNWKLLSSTFLWCCLLCLTRWFQLFSLWIKSSSGPFKWKLLSPRFLLACVAGFWLKWGARC